jgi:uncharacterized protein (DUF2141 family)
MLKQIINIWRNNNGTFLFVCGLAVVSIMSVLWRFDMIPEIGPSLRASPMMIGGRTTAVPTILVVSITSEDAPDAEVLMQIFSAIGIGSELTSPLESRTTTLQDGLSEFVITGLSRGTYAGLAFEDTNGNGQVDLAEDGSPTEPFGLVKVRSQDESKSLSNGAFEVLGEPVFLKIHLLRPKSVSPSRQSQGVR